MAFGNKKPSDQSPKYTEEEIQKEIQKRILKESYRREGRKDAEETTKATLDALEDIVSLTREEMEEIAEQVRAEFKNTEELPVSEPKSNRIFPWLTLILIASTFMLVRRGSSWFLFTVLILGFVILNSFFRKPPSE